MGVQNRGELGGAGGERCRRLLDRMAHLKYLKHSMQEYSHFFEVKLGTFDGPIDLLLHLVKKNELQIEKLALAEVADQYFQCVDAMRELDLEVAGEYLVIAATLVSIKSSVLLDEPPELILDDEGNLVDPHEELLRRLREAQVYKEGALYLGGRALLGIDVFEPPSRLDGVEPPPVKYKPHDAILLGMAFKRLLEKADAAAPSFHISVDSVKIVERMMTILDVLKTASGPVLFEELITDRTSRGALISSLLALLELCKRQMIRVAQVAMFDQITVTLAGVSSDGEGADPEFAESEFDSDDSDLNKSVNE